MPIAAIALGSNLPGPHGSREANLERAVSALRDLGSLTAVSRWHETEPVGYAGQPAFLNGAALLETDFSPSLLLRELLRIERELGRDRSHGIPNGPRSIDLDLILHGKEVLNTPELVLPHPRMHRRRFVLAPLAEIAPGMVHPTFGTTVVELLKSLDSQDPTDKRV